MNIPIPEQPGRCPQCGYTYSYDNFRFIDPPPDDEHISGKDLWLLDTLHETWPRREWQCKKCKTLTQTIEVSIDFIHRITADSPSKAEILERDSPGIPMDARAKKRGDQPATASAALARIVGPEMQSRGEVVAKFWSYIQTNGLHDKDNRKYIHADVLLLPIFRKKKIEMFEISKIFASHIKEHAIPYKILS